MKPQRWQSCDSEDSFPTGGCLVYVLIVLTVLAFLFL